MNHGTKVKVPAAYLLRGTFGGLTGYFQYQALRRNRQYSLCALSAVKATSSTFLAHTGGSLTPVTSRASRHRDTPWGKPRPPPPPGGARGGGAETTTPPPPNPPKPKSP